MCKTNWIFAGLFLLTACAVGPDYVRPETPVPPAYKEAKSTDGWTPAKPGDAVDRGDWWAIYKDPTLDALEKKIDISNQNLKAAEAGYRAALAGVDITSAGLFPTISIGPSLEQRKVGQTKSTTTYNLSANASWSLDVWGRIRRSIESDEAKAQASAADLASARLSAQAALASTYFNLRAQDELKRLLQAIVDSDQRILTIAQNQYKAGIVAKTDVLAAQTQLDSAQALLLNVDVKRTQYEHSIAVLIGMTPAQFVLAAVGEFNRTIPQVPLTVPSVLLQRRPDIASAERTVAAANAQIGVQTAAWFPDLTLGGSYGFSSVSLGKLLQASSNVWSFGPTLAETVFDAGARAAAVEQAKAFYDQSVANYRQTVLTAFQQVEDNLSALRVLAEQQKFEDSSVADARQNETLTLNEYKQGLVPYNNVLSAQILRLNSEQSALNVAVNQILANISLIEALGGGWDGNTSPPAPPPTTP